MRRARWMCGAVLVSFGLGGSGRAEMPTERIGGAWTAIEGGVRQEQPEGQAILLAADPGWGGYTLSASVRLLEHGPEAEAGLVIHYRDGDNYVIYSMRETKGGPFAVLRIVTKPGTSITGDQMPLDDSSRSWHELKADVHGKDVYCYLDGKPSISFSFEGTEPHLGRTIWKVDPDKGKIGLFTRQAKAEAKDFQLAELKRFSDIVTPQKGRRDAQGKLLPRQSYAETMRRSTDWMLNSGTVVKTDMLHASLRGQPPYLLGNWVGADNVLVPGGEFAFNHGMHINGAVEEYLFTGDPKYLEIARKTGDWQLANATPQEFALPNLAPTFVFYQPDGRWENKEWGYDIDKSAYLGASLIKLYAVTGEQKYLKHAQKIAETLTRFQKPEGDWPFRVDAKTGKVAVGYTCSQFFYFEFYSRLAEATGDAAYRRIGDRAFEWMMKNPVKTNQWVGFFGDFDDPGSATSYNQWVPLALAIHLIDHRAENPSYLETAKGLLAWVNKTLVLPDGYHPGIPGVSEQTGDRTLYMHHQLRLAEVHAKLYEATGDPKERDVAEQIANSVTWLLMSDGKMRIGFWVTTSSIPMVLVWNDQFTRLMSCLPETAPSGENHLLQYTSFIREIAYQPKEIKYRTLGRSDDVFKLASKPDKVWSGGSVLAPEARPSLRTTGWCYDDKTGLLKVSHEAPDVRIELK